MAETYYTEEHEWLRESDEEEGVYIVGITDFAQQQLGDVVFVELPEEDRVVRQGEEVAVVESVKAASEIYAPVDGVILAINTGLEDVPALVNSDPMEAGWMFTMRIKNEDQLDDLLDEDAYNELTGEA